MIDRLFVCDERRGTVIRRVLEVEASPTIEQYLRSKLPEPSKSPIKDVAHIYSFGARLFLVDDVGMMMKGTLEHKGLYDVHIGFWDLVLRGREDMCREIAFAVAEDAGTNGVWTAIPLSARATLAFAKRVGFVEESQYETVSLLTMLVT